MHSLSGSFFPLILCSYKTLDNCNDRTWIWALVSVTSRQNLKSLIDLTLQRKPLQRNVSLHFVMSLSTHWAIGVTRAESELQEPAAILGLIPRLSSSYISAPTQAVLLVQIPTPHLLIPPPSAGPHFLTFGMLSHGMKGNQSKIHQDPCPGQSQDCGGALKYSWPAA